MTQELLIQKLAKVIINDIKAIQNKYNVDRFPPPLAVIMYIIMREENVAPRPILKQWLTDLIVHERSNVMIEYWQSLYTQCSHGETDIIEVS